MMRIAGKFESMSEMDCPLCRRGEYCEESARINRMSKEKTSKKVASKAAKLLNHEDADVRSVAASALTQVENESDFIQAVDSTNVGTDSDIPILLKYRVGKITYADVGRLMQLVDHVREFVESDGTDYRAYQVTFANDLLRLK
jgi:hypothetical protein